MGNKRIVKFISFLIIACLIFQLIPTTISCVDGFQSHTQNSKVIFLGGLLHSDALYIGRENQKSSIQKILIKNSSTYVNRIFTIDDSLISFSIQEIPFDFRKVIRQSIPHYFNGSKYRNDHFAI